MREDISGMRFGRLVAIKAVDKAPNGEAIWECKCDCGNYSYVRKGKLVGGYTKTCGCYKRKGNNFTCITHRNHDLENDINKYGFLRCVSI